MVVVQVAIDISGKDKLMCVNIGHCGPPVEVLRVAPCLDTLEQPGSVLIGRRRRRVQELNIY